MLGATVVTACRDSVAPTPPPVIPLYYLKAPTNSGDNQTDTVLATLALPFRVLVRRGDTPAPDITVLWELVDDLGVPYFSEASLTDATGIASSPFHLTLGPWPGTYAVQASVPGVVKPGPWFLGTDEPCGLALCFNATATAGRPAQLRYGSGNHQTGNINTPLGADYVVRVTDIHGNSIRGAVIDWTITAGGGSTSPTRDTTTLPDGSARARHTLGPASGEQTAAATASGLPGAPTVTFTATAIDPGPVADINGIWDWTELYANSGCADTGSYVFTQTGSVFRGWSQQVGVCYGPKDNTSGPDSVFNGFVGADTISFHVTASCIYYATVWGSPPDSVSGTTRCGSDTGTWRGVREKPVAAVTIAPDSTTLAVGATLTVTAQLRAADGARLFFRAVTWSSDNPAVATVSPQGIITAVSAGSAMITASAGGLSGSARVFVQ